MSGRGRETEEEWGGGHLLWIYLSLVGKKRGQQYVKRRTKEEKEREKCQTDVSDGNCGDDKR